MTERHFNHWEPDAKCECGAKAVIRDVSADRKVKYSCRKCDDQRKEKANNER